MKEHIDRIVYLMEIYDNALRLSIVNCGLSWKEFVLMMTDIETLDEIEELISEGIIVENVFNITKFYRVKHHR